MQAPLPPSSSSSRFIVLPPASKMRAPTAVEPVKETMSTFFESTRASPISGEEPVTTLTTPGGNPTWRQMSANSMIASGSWGAGFITMVFPVANAGPTLPAMVTSGKLYGEMQATTPTGWRRGLHLAVQLPARHHGRQGGTRIGHREHHRDETGPPRPAGDHRVRRHLPPGRIPSWCRQRRHRFFARDR